MAIKVTLRQKEISRNRQSLYLDFYPPIIVAKTGKETRREFLGMYVFDKSKTPLEKQHNKETLQLAEQIRQQRENNLNKPEIYTEEEKYKLKIIELGQSSFIEYFFKLANKRKASNYDNWISAYKYLEAFTGGNLKFADLDLKFCNSFKEYLLTTQSNKSIKTKLA